MEFIPTTLLKEFAVNQVVTIHYFEYSKDFKYVGEKHDFWEFVYVDKGRVIAWAEDEKHTLESGDIIFHKPNEWHNLTADGMIPSNVGVISFVCKSKAMNFFKNKILKVNKEQKNLIAKIIEEETNAFDTPLGDVFTKKFERKENQVFASEQLIGLYLTELLISLVRSSIKIENNVFLPTSDNKTFNQIVEFMKNNLDKKLKLDDIVINSLLSKSSVKKLFQEYAGMGAIDFFIKMKMDRAKHLLREDNYNVTQIASELGYDNIHYFSRQFKQQTGMTPTEYMKSVKSMNKIL